MSDNESNEWAEEMAASMPPMTESEISSVAAIFARIDARLTGVTTEDAA